MILSYKKCSLCGETVEMARKSSQEEVFHGSLLTFDTSYCLMMFKRFQDVYGETFATELAVTA
jgi:hypothetical protein